MTWFKVDDNFHHHPKALDAGNAALGLWVRAGSWCGSNLTEGFIPRRIALQMGSRAQVRQLISTGLWIEVNDGYMFHEWSERQPTKAEVESEREANRKRQANYRKRRREAAAAEADADSIEPPAEPESNGVSNSVTNRTRNAVSNGTPTRPDPTRPITTSGQVKEGGLRKQTRATAPRPEAITRGSLALVVSATPDADAEPPTKCPRHRTRIGRIDEPCAPCRDARLAHQAWTEHRNQLEQLARDHRRTAIAHCDRCDDLGWTLDPDTGVSADPARRCTHGATP
ncbi:replication initiation protein [Gordonia phage EMoore]|uniref:Helix-turn-helix DNA binding domain protein n=1 Tax=Gordonia phage EMoore TaxID=2656534 RepID=A0A649VTN4_9CAUD|nr:replication initiation protein [Gordonia phage EMoore]QGJ95836.1 hypothetical protein SEA_EMOORE_50 [Gordonia phage EMoore]